MRISDWSSDVCSSVLAIVDSSWFRGVVRGLGFAFFGYVAFAAVFGRDLQINPVFGVFYVWLWVGIVPMSLFFGKFYKAISPVRTINLALAKLTGGAPDVGLRQYPERSEEHTSELQSLMRISYAVFCLQQ